MNERLETKRILSQLAKEQGGYITAKQALGIGYSYQAQQYQYRAGNWLRIGRGIYRIADWPFSDHNEFILWSLWSNNEAVISHRSALEYYSLGDLRSSKIEITVNLKFSKLNPNLRIYHDRLEKSEIEQHTGSRTTSPIRSVVDVANLRVEVDQLAQIIREGYNRGFFTPSQLQERAELRSPVAALSIERAIRQLNNLNAA